MKIRTPEDKGIFHISSPLLARFPAVNHSFLGRCNGVSTGAFSSLNCATMVGDRAEDVKKNREIAAGVFGFDPLRLVTVKQVHGDNVFFVEKWPEKAYESVEGDAMVTDLRGVALGILTADCLPVLLFDPRKNVIGAVHAGWRGTVKRVAEKAIEAMRERFGSDPADIAAALGPCIGRCCYMVDGDVASEFKKTFGDAGGYMTKEGDGAMIDIQAANVLGLKNAGVLEENIWRAATCTSCRSELLFSYRKDGKTTGRQLSFIMMREEAR